MKTEAEIRAHLADLENCSRKPCNCARTGHAVDCRIGALLFTAAIDLARWILDENPQRDALVEEFAARARRG